MLAILKHRTRRFLGTLLDSKALGKELCYDLRNSGHQKHVESWLLRLTTKKIGVLP